MYNANDDELNIQVNINANIDRIVESEIIIYKYINKILFYFITSYHAFKSSISIVFISLRWFAKKGYLTP